MRGICLRINQGCEGEGTGELAKVYMASVAWLGFELPIGGAVALMVVLASPIWRFPSWTVFELGLALVAALMLLTYWLLRTSRETRKG